MKRFPILALLILAGAAMWLYGCGGDKYKVDTDQVSLDIPYRRLDHDVFQTPKAPADVVLKTVKEKYPDFYREYFAGVVRLGNPDQPEFNVVLAGFLNDVYINQLVDEVNLQYSQTGPIEKEITDAFKRYHTFVPEARVPKVVFCISALNYSVVATDSVMAVGLDMFLGSSYEPYRAMAFPEYILLRKNKEHLVSEVLSGWLLSEFPKDGTKNTLVDFMVYQGKIMFLLNIMLPDYKDDRLFGFTPQNLAFSEENEAQIWAYFVEKKLLFTEDRREIMKYIDEAPFAAGMPREVPGRIGLWVGRNIVKSYLENNPAVSIPELMANTDYKGIFTQSKYKPRYK